MYAGAPLELCGQLQGSVAGVKSKAFSHGDLARNAGVGPSLALFESAGVSKLFGIGLECRGGAKFGVL